MENQLKKNMAHEMEPRLFKRVYQGVFLWTLRVCTLGFWVPKPWSLALNKGIRDPKLRGTNIKGKNSNPHPVMGTTRDYCRYITALITPYKEPLLWGGLT